MATPLSASQTTAMSGATTSRRHGSCISCHNRKSKCDGKPPCTRSGTRRSESPSNSALALKVRQYERLLHEHGINVGSGDSAHEDELMGGTENSTSQKANDRGPWSGSGSASQPETPWKSSSGRTQADDAVAYSRDMTAVIGADDSATAELLIWGRPNFVSLRPMHPTVPQIMLLWQTFLNNFDPLVKLFHAPTVQVTISHVATNLDRIVPNTEALMFAIYLSATVTMTEQQCLHSLSTSKAMLVKRFANATQQALVNARFLKSTDLVVLQALALYLLAARSYIDKQALWILAGIAVRLGETMGLHEEGRIELLSPFEAELRRRLWSQIHLINGCHPGRSAVSDPTTISASSYNDSDLFPSMAKLPEGRERGTDMLFRALHWEVGSCLARLKPGALQSDHASQLEILADFVSRLELLTRKCDPSIPLHLFTILTGRSVAARLRFVVQASAHFSQGANTDTDTDTDKGGPNARESLLKDAVTILGYDAELRSNQSLRPFLWHHIVQFPFDAFVFVLRELRDGLGGQECSAAWLAVNVAYEDHPEFVTQSENPLYGAAGNLAVLAWDRTMDRVGEVGARRGTADGMRRGSFEYPVESYALERLREQREQKAVKGESFAGGVAGNGEIDPEPAVAREPEWEEWQQMIYEAGYWQGLVTRN
ncbi:uncharacterized protein DNG_06923 [Cephalotrichum gorgonifer]|uniref:Xylanolytic transcriptional activator regulatory domain-containing protein n=1 Tax=Cephalotrichum gorgonifer TaxID=2041049 RepID=A0AAE8N3N7_9PEZI|nr:uncharacterized protein DNG_06923 [Cephalotrichum gorgonifer]